MYIFYNFSFWFSCFYVIFTIYSLFIHFLFIFHSHIRVIVKLLSREWSRLYRRYGCNNITHIDKFFHNSLRCTRRRGHSSFSGIFKRGILKRQTRSIQTEGHFGDIKENENFRRFNYRSADKVYKEFMLYAIGRNINKYHRFLYEKLRKFEGKNA